MSPNEFKYMKDGVMETVRYDKDGMIVINEHDTYFPIAIVGIGLRMPGCASPEEFTDMLLEEKTAIDFIPEHRWGTDDFYHPDNTRKGRYSTTKMAFTEKYHHYDGPYFGHSKAESQLLDPQQRQLLECTEMTMDDAGIPPDNLPENTGVYIGMGMIDWPGTIIENPRIYEETALYGTSHSTTANMISSRYGLTGPSIAVDTACAASLTAVHIAAMSIWNGECDWAIAGATSNLYSPETSVAFSKLGVLSSTGNSAPFDLSNNGYVRGEGTGIILMKPLDQAIRDNDMIYCCIRFTASAHNGYSKSLTLPSADAQVHLIEKCYEHSGIPRSIVSFVEAHGTGTPVGDPIETEALGRSLGYHREDVLPISSGKSTFGHLEVCAGMVQIVKATIMIKKRMLYKQINWSIPHSKINFKDLNLKIQLETLPYDKEQKFVVAVNSFGFGGSIVHMVFEEYAPPPSTVAQQQQQQSHTAAGWSFTGTDDVSPAASDDVTTATDRSSYVIMTLSAKCPAALRDTARKYLDWSSSTEDARAVSAWLASRRRHFRYRLPVVAGSEADFRRQLRRFLDEDLADDIVPVTENERKQLMFVYPGWGQQHSRMGVDLYRENRVFRREVEECDAVFARVCGYSALERYSLFTERCDSEAGCKPLIFYYQMARTALFRHQGIVADVCVGAGLGDVAAAYAAGRMTREQCVRTIALRMRSPGEQEFIAAMTDIVGNVSRRGDTECALYSASGVDTDPMDASYWWRTVTSNPDLTKCIAATLATIGSRVNVIEIAGKRTADIERGVSLVPAHPGACVHAARLDSESGDSQSHLRVVGGLLTGGHALADFRWSEITGARGSYVPLPTYAWQHELVMYESHEYRGRRTGLASRAFAENTSRISKDIFDYLLDYEAMGEGRLPGAAQLEYLTEMDERPLTSLSRIHLSPMFTMPGTDEDGFHKRIRIEPRLVNGEIRLVGPDDTVLSRATLEPSLSRGRRRRVDLAAVEARCTHVITHRDIYEAFAERGLRYGTDFRLLDCVRYSGSECVADVKYSLLRHERTHTVLLDAALQAVGVAFVQDTPTTLYLAAEVRRFDMHVAALPRKERFRVHARLIARGLDVVEADVAICDTDGNVNIEMLGVRFVSQTKGPDARTHATVDVRQLVATPVADIDVRASISRSMRASITRDYHIDDDGYLESVARDAGAGIPLDSRRQLDLEMRLLRGDDSVTFEELPVCAQLRNSLAVVAAEYLRKVMTRKEVVAVCVVDDHSDSVAGVVCDTFREELAAGKLNVISTKASSDLHPTPDDDTRPDILRDVLDIEADTNNFVSGYFDLMVYAGTPAHDNLVPLALGGLVQPHGVLIFPVVTEPNELIDAHRAPECDREWSESLEERGFEYQTHAVANPLRASVVTARKGAATPASLDGRWACYSSEGVLARQFDELVAGACVPVKSLDELDAASYDRLLYVPDTRVTDARWACQHLYDVAVLTSGKRVTVVLRSGGGQANGVTCEALRLCAVKLTAICDIHSATIEYERDSITQIKRVLENENSLDRNLAIGKNVSVSRMANYCSPLEDRGWVLEGEVIVQSSANIRRPHHVTEAVCRISSHVSLLAGQGKLHLAGRVSGSIPYDGATIAYRMSACTTIRSLACHVPVLVAMRDLHASSIVLIVNFEPSLKLAAAELARHYGHRLLCYDDLHDDLTVTPDYGKIAKRVVTRVRSLDRDEITRLTFGHGLDALLVDTSLERRVLVDARLLTYAGRVYALGEGGVETRNICNGEFVRLADDSLDLEQWTDASKLLIDLYDNEIVSTIDDTNVELLSKSLKNASFKNMQTYEIDNITVTNGKMLLDADSSYIIIGGEGGFDAESVNWLVDAGAKEILIYANASDTSKWDGSLLISAIENASKHGCTIHECSIDPHNLPAIKASLTRLKFQLRGVFGLGCFTMGEMNAYVAALTNVSVCTKPLKLDYFVACVACFPAGETIAWSVLRSTLCEITSARENGVCVQLGRVRAVLDLRDELANPYDGGMHVTDVLRSLEGVLSGDVTPPLVTISNVNWSALCNDVTSLQYEHLRGARDVVQAAGMSKQEVAEERMCAMLRDMLMVDIDTLDAERPLTSYGVDSMMSTDIAGWAEKNYDLGITQAHVFEGLSIQQLRQQIQAYL